VPETIDSFVSQSKQKFPSLAADLDDLAETLRSMDIASKVSEPVLVSMLEKALQRSIKSSNPKIKFREMTKAISAVKPRVDRAFGFMSFVKITFFGIFMLAVYLYLTVG